LELHAIGEGWRQTVLQSMAMPTFRLGGLVRNQSSHFLDHFVMFEKRPGRVAALESARSGSPTALQSIAMTPHRRSRIRALFKRSDSTRALSRHQRSIQEGDSTDCGRGSRPDVGIAIELEDGLPPNPRRSRANSQQVIAKPGTQRSGRMDAGNAPSKVLSIRSRRDGSDTRDRDL